MIAYSLQALNMSFIYAENGAVALALAEQNHEIGLIICDINMPEVDGIQTVKKLRASNIFSHTPIIILSTDSTNADLTKEIGANALIYKPFAPDKLLTVAQQLLQSKICSHKTTQN